MVIYEQEDCDEFSDFYAWKAVARSHCSIFNKHSFVAEALHVYALFCLCPL